MLPPCLGLVNLLSGRSLFLAADQVDSKHAESESGQAEHREHPVAHAASLGQIEAAGVDDRKGDKGVAGSLVRLHAHIVAVNGRGVRQQLVLQMLLRHVVEHARLHIRVAGIVLQQAQHVGAVDGAERIALHSGDHDLDAVLEQRIAVVGADLGHGVVVILQALDQQLAGAGGDEVGGLGLLIGVAGHIVQALALQLGLYEVAVHIVVQQKFDLGEVALAV